MHEKLDLLKPLGMIHRTGKRSKHHSKSYSANVARETDEMDENADTLIEKDEVNLTKP